MLLNLHWICQNHQMQMDLDSVCYLQRTSYKRMDGNIHCKSSIKHFLKFVLNRDCIFLLEIAGKNLKNI